MSLFVSLATMFVPPALIKNKKIKITNGNSHQGFVLVLILGLLTVLLVAVFAFFTRAQTNRMVSSTSASNQLVQMLAVAAVAQIEEDLLHEMRAGSEEVALVDSSAKRALLPRLVDSNLLIPGTSIPLSLAPSVAPQRVVAQVAGGELPPTLLKQSLHGRAFFQTGEGFEAWDNGGLPVIPNRASPINTSTTSAGSFSPSRWQTVGLVPAGATIVPPDWVYINRQAQTPTTFSQTWANRSPANTETIIGRFAYNVYDVGGLLDLNVIGNLLAPEENGRRGRLHQVSLANATGPLASPNFAEFVRWRSGNDTQSWDGEGALGDPKRNFLKALPGTQRFLTRKDFLRYLSQGNTLPPSLSAYATIFNRDVSRPSYQPEPNRPMLPPGGNGSSAPEQLNPELSAIQFKALTTLSRGSDPDVEVPPGTPVMARRFPLGKLGLLADASASPQDLAYYFGLERQASGKLRYVAAASDGRIKRLEEVALEGREPNFFEVLQAVIVTGSLGRNAGNSSTIDQPRDSLRNLQIMQIGTNIIDQWDRDDFPTILEYPSGATGQWLEVYGTENLPYINSMEFVGYSPAWDPSRLQIWGIFSVWNPHQKTDQSASGIDEFRIVAHSGRASVLYALFVNAPERLMKRLNGGSGGNTNFMFGQSSRTNDRAQNDGFSGQSIVDLNRNRAVVFPNNGTYSEPTVIGGAVPQNASYAGGLLFNEITTDPARSAATGVEYMEPIVPENPLDLRSSVRDGFVANGREHPGVNDFLEQALRDRLLAQENRNPTPDEIQNAKVPPDGSGVFGAKAFNYYRLRGVRNDRPTLHLQYRKAGSTEWQTYQVVDRLFPHSTELDGPPERLDTQTRGQAAGYNFVSHGQFAADPLEQFVDTVTLPSAANAVMPQNRHFFGWRRSESAATGSSGTAMIGAFKADPRTIRFGHQSQNAVGFTLGPPNADASQARSIMSKRAPINWAVGSQGSAIIHGNTNWIIPGGTGFIGPGVTIAGLDPNPYPEFEWFALWRSFDNSISLGSFAGLTRNIPEGNLDNQTNPSRYRDRDGIIRPADGYLGAIPTLAIPGDGVKDDRPIILNRPFRSVGDLGYAFRDLPWKSIDFFTCSSGDLGLLDAFSLEEPEGEMPITAGKININSAPVEVLTALLAATHKDPDGLRAISSSEASDIAEAIVAERNIRGPFRDTGDLVRRVLAPSDSLNLGVLPDARKHEREAAIRTLASLGTTRVWNLLIDLVVQSGHLRPNATDPSQFIVRAERHYWVHLAMDRVTGEVLDQQWESVND